MSKTPAEAMRLDETAAEGQKQQEKETDRKSDTPRERANRLRRFFAIGHQIIEGRAKAQDDNQEDQDDDDFQGDSLGSGKEAIGIGARSNLMRDYRFIPSTAGLILVGILVPSFVLLGFWQLDRAHEREALNRLQDIRLQESPLVLGSKDPVDLDAIRYRELILEGQYDREHQFLVDNQLEGQTAGYHVLAPLRLEGSNRSVLINRGWVAIGADRTQRPDVGGLPEGRVKIRGRADFLHRVGFKLAGAEIPAEGWPAVVQVPEPTPLSVRLGYPVEGFQVLLGPAEPGGYVRQFRPVRLDAGKNRGYALQWFLFAVATFSLFIRSSLRKFPHRS